MKILLTGKNGQVGFELQRALAPLGQIHAVDVSDCNLADEQAIRKLVRQVQPDVIVNPAAYTAVDKAESERELAYAINAKAPRVFGEEASKSGAWIVHYSTDYVFDGTKQGAYTESDTTNPQSVYGQTKRESELGLAQINPHHLILRTSWVVGAHGANFAKTMLRLASEREALNVVADQFGAPTSASLLADVTALLIHQRQSTGKDPFPYGTYHVVAGGETTWFDYARFVLTEAIKAGKQLKVRPEHIHPIGTAEYPTPAMRPANSRLDTTRFRETFALELPHWQVGLNHVLQQIFNSQS